MTVEFCPSCGCEFEQKGQGTACPKCKKDIAAKPKLRLDTMEPEEFDLKFTESLLRSFDSTLAAKHRASDPGDSPELAPPAATASSGISKESTSSSSSSSSTAAALDDDVTAASEVTSTVNLTSLVTAPAPDPVTDQVTDAGKSSQQAAVVEIPAAPDHVSDPEVYRTQKTIDAGSNNATVSALHKMPKRLLGLRGSKTIDDYQLEKELGKGSFGTVWRARQSALNRTVALKLLHDVADAGGGHDQIDEEEQNLICAEFLREAQFNGRLDHPNIVPIHELGIGENGKPFYAMKEIRGISWRDVIRDKSLKENLEIFNRVAEAIGFAHSRNILHCDLKPENVMLGEFGEVLVVDWGQAIDLSDSNTLRAGGSPVYLAPEMASYFLDAIIGEYDSASSKLIGKATDTYVLGAILFEIITGFPPHPFRRGETAMDVVKRAADNEIRDYSQFADDELMQIALHALGVDGRRRYESVAELQHDLAEYDSRQRSIEARVRAEQDLAEAEAHKGYDIFQKARFGFEEAVEFWPDNQLAHRGLREAKLKFAALALANQDFDLGLGQLGNADSEDEANLKSKLLKGRAARDRRKKLVGRLLILVIAVIAIGLGTNAILISVSSTKLYSAKREQRQAQAMADEAQQQAASAQADTDRAEREKQDAQKLTAAAKRQAASAQADADQAETDKKKAESLADKAKLIADTAKTEAALARKAKSDVDFRNSISSIDRQIMAGENELARDGLTKVSNKKGWEWGRLELLTHPEVQSLSARVVAQSLSGNRKTFAFATPQGVQVRSVDDFEVPQEFAFDGATAVALSHEADLLAVAARGEITFYGLTDTAKEFKPLRAQSDRIQHLEFSPAADLLLSVGAADPASKGDRGNGESDLMVWRRDADGWKRDRFVSGDGKKMQSAHFSHDARRIVTAGDEEIHVMNYDETRHAYEHYADFSFAARINVAAFANKAGDEVMCGCDDSSIVLLSLRAPPNDTPRTAVDRSRQQAAKATANRTQGTLEVLDVFPGHLRAVRSLDLIVEESGARAGTMVSAGDDGNILLWNCRDKSFKQFLGGHSTSVRYCGIAGERATILSVSAGLSEAAGNAAKIRKFEWEEYQKEYIRLAAKDAGSLLSASQSSSSQKLVFVDEAGRMLAFDEPEQGAHPLAEWTISCQWKRHVPAGGKLFSESTENKIYVWDLETGWLDHVFAELPTFSRFEVSSDGSKVALLISGDANSGNRIEIWDAKTHGLLNRCFPDPQTVPLSALAISPAGDWIVGGSIGLFVWSVETGKLQYETPRNETDPQNVLDKIVFIEDPSKPGHSSKFIVGWNQKWLRTFDAAGESGQWIEQYQHSYKAIADAMDIAGEQYLLIESGDGFEVLALPAGGKISERAFFAGGNRALFSKFQPNTVLVLNHADRAMPVVNWNWQNGSKSGLKVAEALAGANPSFPINAIDQVRQLESGTILIEALGQLISLSKNLTVLDLHVVPKPACQYAAYINDQELVTLHGQGDAKIRFWKLSTRQQSTPATSEVTQCYQLDGSYTLCQCSPDEKYLFTLNAAGSVMNIYDTRSKESVIQEALLGIARVQCVCWSADSRQIFLGLDSGKVIVWEFEKDVAQEPRQRLQDFQFDLDGTQDAIKSISLDKSARTMLVVSNRGVAQVFHRTAGDTWIKINLSSEGENQRAMVVAGALSPDGNRAVTASKSGVMTLWNIDGLEETAFALSLRENGGLLELYYHKSEVRFVLFSPNGQSLITAEAGAPGAVVWPTAGHAEDHAAVTAE